MKTLKKLIPAFVLLIVIIAVAVMFPSVVHNIIQDAITKR